MAAPSCVSLYGCHDTCIWFRSKKWTRALSLHQFSTNVLIYGSGQRLNDVPIVWQGNAHWCTARANQASRSSDACQSSWTCCDSWQVALPRVLHMLSMQKCLAFMKVDLRGMWCQRPCTATSRTFDSSAVTLRACNWQASS